MLHLVGLGPAGPDLVTVGTRDLLDGGWPVFLRTRRHPAASVVPDGTVDFDDVCEAADRIEDVYREIVERLVDAEARHSSAVYAVP
ncbi:MAG TPA: SAM-dependent methyltransferase, partial [Microthrixaceae bacterium]|nr:SAM-dependent methyltransferase [Microthrixaceae bacterium]